MSDLKSDFSSNKVFRLCRTCQCHANGVCIACAICESVRIPIACDSQISGRSTEANLISGDTPRKF